MTTPLTTKLLTIDGIAWSVNAPLCVAIDSIRRKAARNGMTVRVKRLAEDSAKVTLIHPLLGKVSKIKVYA